MGKTQLATLPLDEVAERLLEELKPDSPGRLLSLGAADCELLFERFQRQALRLAADLPPAQQALIEESPWALPESTFEHRERLTEAAALSALMHDQRTPASV